VFGIGINAPFGLVTEYDDDFIGRYQGIKSDVKTINVNPAISWQATPNFAVGLGVNWQRIDAEFTQRVNYSGAIAQAAQQAAAGGQIPASLVPTIVAATPGYESKAKIDGDDDAWGWNVGVLWDVSPTTRVGASYRSEIKYDIRGNASFENPTVTVPPALAPVLGVLTGAINTTTLYNSGVKTDIKLPAIVNVSFFSQISPQWDVMADAQWTGWSNISELRFNTTPALTTVPLEWDDTWKLAVGASYRHNDQWKLRFGVAFDQTPVTSHPTPRLPDSDRWWFAVGGEYRHSPNLKFDAGFVYIKGDTANFSQNLGSTASFGLINGSYDASVTIFSLQGVYSF